VIGAEAVLPGGDLRRLDTCACFEQRTFGVHPSCTYKIPRLAHSEKLLLGHVFLLHVCCYSSANAGVCCYNHAKRAAAEAQDFRRGHKTNHLGTKILPPDSGEFGPF
jgi:hypothetical protein